MSLKCMRCGAEYTISKMFEGCPRCRSETVIANLSVEYDLDTIANVVSKEKLETPIDGLWKFKELLPIDKEENMISCGEGNTPLLHCRRLGEKIGFDNLYIKDESRNPTWSFKDRLACTAISKGLDFGVKVVTLSSAGNQGAATAAYAAKAGMDCVIFCSPYVSKTMLTFMRAYGAKVVITPTVFGSSPYEIMYRCVKDYGWYPTGAAHTVPPTGNPYGIEGYKTIGYEISAQLGWKAPEKMVVPVGHSEGIYGVWKGFKEFYKMGFIGEVPTMVAVEAATGGPLTHAVRKGLDHIEEVQMKPTIATSIGTNITTYQGLAAIKESNGITTLATDDEIMEMQSLLAKTEGIYPEPASAASLVGARKLRAEGKIDRDEIVVCLITSGGLKDPEITAKTFPPILQIESKWPAFTKFMDEFYGLRLSQS